MTERILIVEHDHDEARLMRAWAERDGHPVETASSALRALAALAERDAAVAVCDVSLPDQDGLTLTREIRERHPETVVVLTTRNRDFEVARAGLQYGVADYLLKPFGEREFSDAVEHAFDRYRTAAELREGRDRLLAELVRERARAAGAISESVRVIDGVVRGLLRVLDCHWPGGSEHSRRVASIALEISRVLGTAADEDLLCLERAALMHDIGKLLVPPAILHKPGPLTTSERHRIQTHAEEGYRLLKDVPGLGRVADIVLATHERIDGRGYPQGLRGPEIPFESRIIAVADAFEVMTRRTHYREPRPPEAALQELDRCAGQQFDPMAINALRMVITLERAMESGAFGGWSGSTC